MILRAYEISVISVFLAFFKISAMNTSLLLIILKWFLKYKKMLTIKLALGSYKIEMIMNLQVLENKKLPKARCYIILWFTNKKQI